MPEPLVEATAISTSRSRSTASDLLALTKPRLSANVLFTAGGGLWLAPGHISLTSAVVMLLATAGIVGSANAFNCYIERESDRFMARTRSRPLPSGRMEPQLAFWFAVSLSAVCLPALALASNLLTGMLGLLALLSYVGFYTPMKARHWSAMLVGGIPGALPPLMGWTAVTNRMDAVGLALFAILFFWQMPHFIAIALFRKDEYRAAGLHSVPLALGDFTARAHIVLYTAVLIPVSLLPYLLGAAGRIYMAAAVILDAAFLAFGVYGFVRRLGKGWARQMFALTLVYLPVLFIALMVNGKL